MPHINPHYTYIGAARMSTKGQVTIPLQVREILGLHSGSIVTFAHDNDGEVTILSPSLLALTEIQSECNEPSSGARIHRPADITRLTRYLNSDSRTRA